ncbi:MAG: hypothetical protein MI717_08565 [Spirochaetales bacterium]|nr:hypothetical protein [Spirochaetales bacterium]
MKPFLGLIIAFFTFTSFTLGASGTAELPTISMEGMHIDIVGSDDTQSLENYTQKLAHEGAIIREFEWKDLRHYSSEDTDIILLGSRYFSKEINGISAFLPKMLDAVQQGAKLILFNNFISFPDSEPPQSWTGAKLTTVMPFHSDAEPVLPINKILDSLSGNFVIPDFNTLHPTEISFENYLFHEFADSNEANSLLPILQEIVKEDPIPAFGWIKPTEGNWTIHLQAKSTADEWQPILIEQKYGEGSIILTTLFTDRMAANHPAADSFIRLLMTR